MSETYQSKRERWQRMLESLPDDLRGHISLRNVEAVASLTPRAQKRLSEAVQAGLKRLPRAIEQLRIDPEISVEDLLTPPAVPAQPIPSQNSNDIKKELTDLIQTCYPDMPHLSAEALAGADALAVVREAAEVFQQVFASTHLKVDFVMVVLYVLVRQNLERLEAIIASLPACQKTLSQSSLPWNINDWRK